MAIVAALRLLPLVAEITNNAPGCRTLEDLLGSREKEKERGEERDRPIVSILPWRLTPHDSGLDEGLSKLGRCRRMIFDHGGEREGEAETCPVTL